MTETRCSWCDKPPVEHSDIRRGHRHWIWLCPNAPHGWRGVFVDHPIDSPPPARIV